MDDTTQDTAASNDPQTAPVEQTTTQPPVEQTHEQPAVDPAMAALAEAAAAAPAQSIADELRRPAEPAAPFVPSGPHTYPDGSVSYGAPPFPDESPKQRAEREARESPESQELIAKQQAQARADAGLSGVSGIVTADQVQAGRQPQ